MGVGSAQEALSVLLHRPNPPFAVVTELTVRGGGSAFLDLIQDDPKLRTTTALVFTRTANPPPLRATFVFQKDTDAHRLVVVLDGLAQHHRGRNRAS
ncbi:MAG: hypothetical protein ACJ790_11845 [Myxococcaceae bacterium]